MYIYLPFDTVSSREYDSLVDQGTTTGVDPYVVLSLSFVPEYGDRPRILSKVCLVVEGSGDSKTNAIWITVTTALGHVGSLDTSYRSIGRFLSWFLSVIGTRLNDVVARFDLWRQTANFQVVRALTSGPVTEGLGKKFRQAFVWFCGTYANGFSSTTPVLMSIMPSPSSLT